MGVKSNDWMDGCTIEPPAEREYAVDPVGEATIRPSATASVIKWPSTKHPMDVKCG